MNYFDMKCYLFYSKKTDDELLGLLKKEPKLPSQNISVIQNILHNNNIQRPDNCSAKFLSKEEYISNIKLYNLTLSKDYHCKNCLEIIDLFFDEFCPECGIYDPLYQQEDFKKAQRRGIYSGLAWFFTIIWVLSIFGFLFLKPIYDECDLNKVMGILLFASACIGVTFHSFVKQTDKNLGAKRFYLRSKDRPALIGKAKKEKYRRT
jgi:hypothetical protein